MTVIRGRSSRENIPGTGRAREKTKEDGGRRWNECVWGDGGVGQMMLDLVVASIVGSTACELLTENGQCRRLTLRRLKSP